MAAPASLRGRTAVVTGAASGIGRSLALGLGRRGINLALADLDEAGLAQTALLAAPSGVRVSRHRLDVADRDAVADFPDAVLAEHPAVDILVNNAGVALAGTFEQVSDADFEWLFGVNFWGVVRVTRAFLPLLRESDDARLVNLSSLYGLISPPGEAPYSASKFAVRGFTQALRQELKGTRIGVTLVHPGGVATSIARNVRLSQGLDPELVARGQARAAKALCMPPDQAAEIIIGAMERRQARVLVGSDAKLVSLFERLAPVGHARMFGWRMFS